MRKVDLLVSIKIYSKILSSILINKGKSMSKYGFLSLQNLFKSLRGDKSTSGVAEQSGLSTSSMESKIIKDSGREKLSDKKFDFPVSKESFINKLFERLVALRVEFKEIDFRYCIFDAAYIRNCSFKDCNFTGCRFINCNLTGSSFTGCKFNYATFDKTHIDNDILESGCPSLDNLKLKFARSLRLNYQQIGDSKSANKAICIELQATEDHLHNAWKSNEPYYRKKYKGFNRFKAFGEWLEFKILDLIWGNGESAWKLYRAILIILLLIAAIHVIFFSDPIIKKSHLETLQILAKSYFDSLFISLPLFLGILKPKEYPDLYLTIIFLVRLIMFGFFMSIIIKRFNRR